MHVAVVGGSDAGIEAARRTLSLDPSVEVTVLVADAYPNFSICGIPYYVSGEVADWRDLAHRTVDDLEAAGIQLLLNSRVSGVDCQERSLRLDSGRGQRQRDLSYDRLVLATGAHPAVPPIEGLRDLGAWDGVFVLHTMADTFAIHDALDHLDDGATVAILGAGYVGLEMADALTLRGISVVVIEQLPQVLGRTLDPNLAALVEADLKAHGVDVRCNTVVHSVVPGSTSRVLVRTSVTDVPAELVLVSTGVRPSTKLAVAAGLRLGAAGAIHVDRQMRTSAEAVWAAGDCVLTHHRLLAAETYMPLGTTAHKQGRVAGENVLGGDAEFAGSLGTQSVKLFDQVAAATGLGERAAAEAGFDALTAQVEVDDHKRYYPAATPLRVRLTAERITGRLLGAQLLGTYGAEVSKRLDVLAAAVFNGNTVAQVSEIDLSYTPPLSSPWDPIQQAAHHWQDQRSRRR